MEIKIIERGGCGVWGGEGWGIINVRSLRQPPPHPHKTTRAGYYSCNKLNQSPLSSAEDRALSDTYMDIYEGGGDELVVFFISFCLHLNTNFSSFFQKKYYINISVFRIIRKI